MKKIWINLLMAATAAAGLALVAGVSLSAEKATPVHLTIRASEMRYTPSALHLKAGVPVHLTLINDGKVLHDFNLKGVQGEAKDSHAHHAEHSHSSEKGQLHLAVQPGKSASLHLTPAAGEFIFYCSVPGHREAGMAGKLLVH